MSENMDVVSKEVVKLSKKNEDMIVNNIEKGYFFKILNNYGFLYDDLRVIFESEEYTNSTRETLNIILRTMKDSHSINLYSSVLFLEEFTTVKKILLFMDSESEWVIKTELSKKYNIEIETNDLFELLG